MSLLDDFKNIKKNIVGEEKYNAIEEYLKIMCPQDRLDKYFSEMKNVWLSSPGKYNDEITKLKNKYNIILLDDVLYKREEWEKFEIWYNENHLKRKVEIKDIWHTDYDDIRCHAILYENDDEVASIIASEDEREFNDDEVDDQDIEFNLDFFKNKFKCLIYNSFDNYKTLPKISECSKLLQDIYDDVCSADSTICHISDEDWEKYYTDEYSDKDIEKLEEEIKKYKLDNIVTIDEDRYKIIGYGNLEIMFNDDRNFEKEKEEYGAIL